MWGETLTPHPLIVFAAKRLKSRGGALKGAHLLATCYYLEDGSVLAMDRLP
jgi:hypothetical protein